MVKATLITKIAGEVVAEGTREFDTLAEAYDALVESERFASGFIPGIDAQTDTVLTVSVDIMPRPERSEEDDERVPCSHPECIEFRNMLKAEIDKQIDAQEHEGDKGGEAGGA